LENICNVKINQKDLIESGFFKELVDKMTVKEVTIDFILQSLKLLKLLIGKNEEYFKKFMDVLVISLDENKFTTTLFYTLNELLKQDFLMKFFIKFSGLDLLVQFYKERLLSPKADLKGQIGQRDQNISKRLNVYFGEGESTKKINRLSLRVFSSKQILSVVQKSPKSPSAKPDLLNFNRKRGSSNVPMLDIVNLQQKLKEADMGSRSSRIVKSKSPDLQSMKDKLSEIASQLGEFSAACDITQLVLIKREIDVPGKSSIKFESFMKKKNDKEEIDQLLLSVHDLSSDVVNKYFILNIIERCSSNNIFRKVTLNPTNMFIKELNLLQEFSVEKTLSLIKKENISLVYKILTNFSEDFIGVNKLDLFLLRWMIDLENNLGKTLS
jgi:hypothetical protein